MHLWHTWEKWSEPAQTELRMALPDIAAQMGIRDAAGNLYKPTYQTVYRFFQTRKCETCGIAQRRIFNWKGEQE